MQQSVVAVTQLAVLAALVDGKADTAELDTLATAISGGMEGATRDEVRGLADRMVTRYTDEKLAGQPVLIVRRGERALKMLRGPQRRFALQVARQVAEASDGVDASEAAFLDQLVRYTR